MKKQQGFSLMELLIVVTIVGLLSGWAYSSYNTQVERSRRTEMQGMMMSFATSLEQWRAQNFSYAGATIAALAPDMAASNHYAVNMVLSNANQSFELVAVPSGQMAGTGQMRLDSQGRTCYNPTSDAACDLTNAALRWSK